MPDFGKHAFFAAVLGLAVGICACGYLLDWSATYCIYNVHTGRYFDVESVEWGIMGYKAFFYDASDNSHAGRAWTLSFFQLFIILSIIIVLSAFLLRHRRKGTSIASSPLEKKRKLEEG